MNIPHDVNAIELDELNESKTDAKPMFPYNLELVKNVKVQLTVRLGDTEISVDDLFGLKNGSVVKLNKETTSPVDIELDGKVVARGIIVAVDDNYGIQITDIAQP